jgi:hypothetical protein
VKFTQQKRVVKNIPPTVGRYGITMAANAGSTDAGDGGG